MIEGTRREIEYGHHRRTHRAICKWCGDNGCLACEGEIRKYEAQVTEQIKAWRPPSDLDLKRIAEIANSFYPPLSDENKRLFIAAAQMPPKLFRVERDDSDDMAALKRVFSANALQDTFADGVTPEAMEVIYRKAEQERVMQRIRKMRQVPMRRVPGPIAGAFYFPPKNLLDFFPADLYIVPSHPNSFPASRGKRGYWHFNQKISWQKSVKSISITALKPVKWFRVNFVRKTVGHVLRLIHVRANSSS